MNNQMIENITPAMKICPLLSVARAIGKDCGGLCIGTLCGWWHDGSCAILRTAAEVEGMSGTLDELNNNGIVTYEGRD